MLGWNAAAAQFAYGYAQLALRRYLYVGNDDLACGPWPDNEPATTGVDWQTGQPNAKFYVVQMLARGRRLTTCFLQRVHDHRYPFARYTRSGRPFLGVFAFFAVSPAPPCEQLAGGWLNLD